MEKIAKEFLKKNPKYGKSIIENLGSGYNGSAYLTDKKFVVKITKDKAEYNTTKKIVKKANGKYTPKYYYLKEVGDIYIIVMDYVELVDLTSEENFLMNSFRDKIIDFVKSGQNTKEIKKNLEKISNKKIKKIFFGLVDIVDGLIKIGIDNVDIQENNLGFIGNKLVAFDVVDNNELNESVKRIIIKLLKESTNKV